MGDSAKRGHNPDMSGAREGSAKPFKVAKDYVPQPKGAYGECSGLQPVKARTRCYTPEVSGYPGGNGSGGPSKGSSFSKPKPQGKVNKENSHLTMQVQRGGSGKGTARQNKYGRTE